MVSEGGGQRHLVVNADDFGMSESVNRGVIRAHEHGIVTSASLMVRRGAAAAAGAYARSHPQLDLGLHIDLAEWAYEGTRGWQPLYEVVDLRDEEAVAQELERQLRAFRRLVGRDPTHLDSHQHLHRAPGTSQVAVEAAERLGGVPVREVSGGIRYCGEFHGETGRGEPFPEGVTVASLVGIIERLPAGVTELACHPADGAVHELPDHYGTPRLDEVRALCDPSVRVALRRERVTLTTFRAVREL